VRVLGEERPNPLTRLIGRRGRGLGVRLVIAGAFGLAFLFGAAAQSTGFFGVIVRPALEAGIRAPTRWFRAQLATPRRVELDLAFDDYQRLALQRERALAARALFASEDDYVSARLKTDGKEARVKLRLKGDSAAHLQGEKWSFRVDVRGGETVLGLARFSLHHPATRNYVTEWLYHRALAREDVISLRYEFVDLTLNGKDLGIYALEEHFEKQLIERSRRRDGPILRLDEELMWREAHQQVRPFMGAQENGYGAYEASAVDGFKSAQLVADPVAGAALTKAAKLLEAFRRGELATSDVFDVDRLATYFALTDLLGAEHGARWHNLRFYFNPVTSRLEPIGFDAECKPTPFLSGVSATLYDARSGLRRAVERPLHTRMFADPAFRARYFAELERVAQPEYVDALFRELGPELADALSVLHREFLQVDSPEPLIRRNQAYLRSALEPYGAIRAGTASSDGTALRVEIGNLQSIPIELLGLGPAAGGPALATLDPPVLLAPRAFGELVKFASVSLPAESAAPGDVAHAPLRARWRIPGTQRVVEEELVPSAWSTQSAIAADVTRKPANLERFEFIEVDVAKQLATIRPGSWTLAEDLVVPPGLTLRAGPGTRLDLREHAKIFSRSRLDWVGSRAQPIELVSSDETGEGLVVVQAGDVSRLDHVRFEGLRSSNAEGYKLTGAVTFFEAPVEIRSSEFLRNRAEDALNVFRSRVVVTDSVFAETQSDAFDCDFCEGEFARVQFRALGNDGVDVSGAVLHVSDIVVDGARDKGISVGEGSRVVAERVVVSGANAGLASKDLGVLSATDVTIRDSRYRLVALVKKAEFGASRLDVKGLRTEGQVGRDLIDDSAEVFVDGARLAPTGERDQLWELLYGENAPGRSIR